MRCTSKLNRLYKLDHNVEMKTFGLVHQKENVVWVEPCWNDNYCNMSSTNMSNIVIMKKVHP